MSHAATLPAAQTDAGKQRLFWLTTVALAAIFFYKNHHLTVSQYEMWVPWTDGETFTTAGGNTLKGLALSLVGLLGLGLLLRKDGRRLSLASPLGALMIGYLLWCIASVGWSVDPGNSLRHLAVFVFCFIGALGISRQFEARDLVRMTLVVYSVYFLIGLACELALGTFRPWADGYRFAGTLHPNAQGADLGVLCLSAFAMSRMVDDRKRRWYLIWLGVAFAFVLLTKSRTSAAACVASALAIWGLDVSGRAKVYTVLAISWCVGMAALWAYLLGVDVVGDLGQAAMLGREEESSALTGRIPIWQELMSYVCARPWVGYGYEAFWTPEHIEDLSDALHWVFREAHSTYVETLLGVGFIGAFLLLSCVLTALYLAAKRHRQTGDPAYAFVVGFLVFSMTTGIMESGSVSASFETTMAGSALAMLAFQRSKSATATAPAPAPAPAPTRGWHSSEGFSLGHNPALPRVS
jgi:O-antigen ligase